MVKNTIFFLLCTMLVVSCMHRPEFKVEGTIAGAEGKQAVFELSDIDGIKELDSVELSARGKFSFTHPRYDMPEFFRLRVDGQIINFVVDSTETVSIDCDYKDMSVNYSITGSRENEKIKELSLLQIGMENKVNELMSMAAGRQIGLTLYEDTISKLVKEYKDKVKMDYIFKAPNTASAYFALFQRINGLLMFDPLNSKEDIKCFAAVATSLINKHPHSDRAKHLENLTLKGMKNTRMKDMEQAATIDMDEIGEVGIIDISLKDKNGNMQTLSALKGKVVILDFIVYQTTVSVSHNLVLRELYDKYKDKGLEIYQVSLDADEHYWRQASDNLPWICVRDEAGIYSPLVETYNITEIPSVYVINKANELVERNDDMKGMEAAIGKLL